MSCTYMSVAPDSPLAHADFRVYPTIYYLCVDFDYYPPSVLPACPQHVLVPPASYKSFLLRAITMYFACNLPSYYEKWNHNYSPLGETYFTFIRKFTFGGKVLSTVL